MSQLLFVYLLFVAPSSPIYQCVGTKGEPYFSDRYCIDGARIETTTTSIIEHTPLTDAEMQQLNRLESARAKQPSQRRTNRRTGERHGEQNQSSETCQSTRQNLRELRDERRKGYSAKDADNLERRERQLKKLRRRLC